MGEDTIRLQGWIERIQAGDSTGFDELMRWSSGRLERQARTMLRDYPGVSGHEQTADVLQSATWRLYRALKEVSPGSVRDFFRLASVQIRRELIDLARHYRGLRGKNRPLGNVARDEESAGFDPVADFSDTTLDPSRLALWTEFHQQIEGFPDEEREIVDLIWYQGLSQADAARLLGISERTVKRRWREARLRLYRVMGGRLPD